MVEESPGVTVAYQPELPPGHQGGFSVALQLSVSTGLDGHFRMTVPRGKGKLYLDSTVPSLCHACPTLVGGIP